MQTKVLVVIYLVIYISTLTLQYLLYVWKTNYEQTTDETCVLNIISSFPWVQRYVKNISNQIGPCHLSWCSDGLLAEALASHKKFAMKNTLPETWKIQPLSHKTDVVELNPTIGGRRGSELAHKLIPFNNWKNEKFYIYTRGK